ncbi:MAG: flagellar motor protein MotB [Bdellovibrionales bacterium]
MAEKKPMIVIKRVIVQGGGHHGGSWKVALADFMTAMMAFFLVMWLLGQSEETKKAIADYFSTPSVIEYNFQNYGVELTLEKLFLDLLNEPLKAFQSFLEPVDSTPNLLDMGSAKVVVSTMADQLGDIAKNVQVGSDGFNFDIPDNILFIRGTSIPTPDFLAVMDKIKAITSGLQDADIRVTSAMFNQTVASQSEEEAKRIANQRLDFVKNKIQASLEHNSTVVSGTVNVKDKRGEVDPNKLIGFIKINITQKPIKSDGSKSRKLDDLFGTASRQTDVYEQYLQELTNKKKRDTQDRR